jgi:GT2 family glycosyltransferase
MSNDIREEYAGLPEIDCVVIGVNCSSTLANCIESIRDADYPQRKLHIFYVDGGSTDDSREVAGQCWGVRVIELNSVYPTPGAGRNAGWKKGSSPFVQFLDSDTLLDAGWLKRGIEAIEAEESIGAVSGLRREIHPGSSVFNWIGDIEWNGHAGESECFGGDVLIRRLALVATGGYDELLVAGEDPDLSRRIIRSGWKIVSLDALMTMHDLAMKTLGQYLRRAYRSGYGFAAVRLHEKRAGSTFWRYDLRKITIKGGGFMISAALAIMLLISGETPVTRLIALFPLGVALCLLLAPRLFRIDKFMQELGLDRTAARRYAWHCSLVVIPQLFGVIRFHTGHIFGLPLRNRRNSLRTERSKTNR